MRTYSTFRVLNLFFEDRLGGPTKRIIDVGVKLKNYGVDTILCLPNRGGNAAEIASKKGIAVRRIDFERIPRRSKMFRIIQWLFLQPRDISRFMNLYRAEQPALVHVNGIYFLAPVFAAKIMGIPIVWHLNDILLSRRLAAWFNFLPRVLANKIVVSSKAVTQHYGLAKVPHEVVYAPVDIQQFKPSSERHLRQANSIPRIALVSNWIPGKGIEYFLEAVALVRQKYKGTLEIVMAGAKFDETHINYCQMIDTMITDLDLRHILQYVGFIESIQEFLGTVDILCMSSLSESFSMVVLEGMAAGLPVVATDVGGPRELLYSNPQCHAGIIVPPKDPASMADAILKLLHDPTLAQQLGENGRQHAELYFNLEAIAEQHLQIYQAIIPNVQVQVQEVVTS